MLAPLVEELKQSGVAVEDNGATCIFVPKIKVPLIIQKSDGGFNYDTTDMAALRYRVQEKKADQIVYVTDKAQEFHFKQVFGGGIKAGIYDPANVTLKHMQFGTVMQETEEVDPATGETKKKIERMKSRSGDTVKLAMLLDEAKASALKVIEARLAQQQEAQEGGEEGSAANRV